MFRLKFWFKLKLNVLQHVTSDMRTIQQLSCTRFARVTQPECITSLLLLLLLLLLWLLLFSVCNFTSCIGWYAARQPRSGVNDL